MNILTDLMNLVGVTKLTRKGLSSSDNSSWGNVWRVKVTELFREHIQLIKDIIVFSAYAHQMILSGRSIIAEIIGHVRAAKIQAQPCGVDLKCLCLNASEPPSVISLDSLQQFSRKTRVRSAQARPLSSELSETVDTPLSLMGQIFVRSSLFRSGALLSVRVMDSGYKGR